VSEPGPLAWEASMMGGAPIQKTLPILFALVSRFPRLLGRTYIYSLNTGLLYESDSSSA
jgi:hypothetical protein